MHLNHSEVEEALGRLYTTYLNRAPRDLPPALLARMGCPFLVLPGLSWCEAERRVAVIGKLPHYYGFDEGTYDWGAHREIWSMQQALDLRGSVEELMCFYRFGTHEELDDPAEFGRAVGRLRAAAGRSVPASTVITNLLRCNDKDQADGYPWKGRDEHRR